MYCIFASSHAITGTDRRSNARRIASLCPPKEREAEDLLDRTSEPDPSFRYCAVVCILHLRERSLCLGCEASKGQAIADVHGYLFLGTEYVNVGFWITRTSHDRSATCYTHVSDAHMGVYVTARDYEYAVDAVRSVRSSY